VRGRVWLTASIVLLLATASLPGAVFAQGPNQAGLVFVYGDGRVEALCVSFTEEQMSGADLLTLSGVDVVLDTASMGVTVCQVEGEGCAFPAEPCFCQCMGGGECAYWNYFYRDPGEGEWIYSALGALVRKVRPGSVEAWVWGDGQTPPGDDLTFAAICAPPAPTVTPPPTLTAQPPAAIPPTVAPVESQPAIPSPTAAPTNTPFPRLAPTVSAAEPLAPSPAAGAGLGSNPSSYWLFGLMVLVLVAVGAVVWWRRT